MCLSLFWQPSEVWNVQTWNSESIEFKFPTQILFWLEIQNFWVHGAHILESDLPFMLEVYLCWDDINETPQKSPITEIFREQLLLPPTPYW